MVSNAVYASGNWSTCYTLDFSLWMGEGVTCSTTHSYPHFSKFSSLPATICQASSGESHHCKLKILPNIPNYWTQIRRWFVFLNSIHSFCQSESINLNVTLKIKDWCKSVSTLWNILNLLFLPVRLTVHR